MNEIETTFSLELTKENLSDIWILTGESWFDLESKIRYDYGHNQIRTYHFRGSLIVGEPVLGLNLSQAF